MSMLRIFVLPKTDMNAGFKNAPLTPSDDISAKYPLNQKL